MKISTLIKLGALGVAAASTAAGSVLLTTKAVKKLGNETFPDDPNQKGVNINNAPSMNGAVSSSAQPAQVYQAPNTQVIPEAYVAPVPTPIPAVEYAPTPAPIPAAPVQEAVPTPVVAPVAEPVVEEKYTDVPMNLPYLAGKLGEEDKDAAEIIVTPSEQKAAEIAEPVAAPIPVVEPVLAEAPVVEPVAAPIPVVEPVVAEAPVVEPVAAPIPVVEPVVAEVPVVEPVAAEVPVVEPVVAEAPVVEPVAAPIPVVEPVLSEPVAEPAIRVTPEPITAPVTPAEPEVVLPTSEPISYESEPVVQGQTFADIDPLSQGFSIAMAENLEGDALPPMESTTSEYTAPEAEAPVTFDNLTAEYVEEIPATVEEPVVAEVPVVEPAVAEVPVAEPEPVVSVHEAEGEGKTVQIGGAVVSDKATDPAVAAVVNTFKVPASNLVSIAAEGNSPMVFEFLYEDMKTDATLMNVYFVLPDGQATLPPEAERENVLAFGRNFITGNEELRSFLA